MGNSLYAEWTREILISGPSGSFRPHFTAQGDTIHVLYDNQIGRDKICYVRSENAGIDWTQSLVLSDTSVTNSASYPYIIKNDSKIIALWRHNFIEGVHDTNIGYLISYDCGLSWTEVDYVFEPNIDLVSDLTAYGFGDTINIFYKDYDDGNPIINFVQSTDFGQSWAWPRVLLTAGEVGSIDAVAYENMIHCVWTGNFDAVSYWETYYIKSNNGGETWSESVPLTTIDSYNSYWPSISVNSLGKIALCWTDFKYSPGPFSGDLLVRYSFDDGVSWIEEEQITFDHLSKHSNIYWFSDTLHVVRSQGSYEYRSIYYQRSDDGGASWGQEQRLDSDPNDSYMPRVVSSDNNDYVIWADDRYDPDNDVFHGIYFTRNDRNVEIDEDIFKPEKIRFLDVYPNPFNSTTIIAYADLEGGDIAIYDIKGSLVNILHTSGGKEGTIAWDATNAFGEKVSSGIYFAKAQTPQGIKTIKLLFLR
ncbi:MAG: T9SS type A sorting domain-containing protein [candidate division Zixibacteria bacterium]|nr:T9SS type A sorting domain-containing protein [candidate division Zixibacteria bacterium]